MTFITGVAKSGPNRYLIIFPRKHSANAKKLNEKEVKVRVIVDDEI